MRRVLAVYGDLGAPGHQRIIEPAKAMASAGEIEVMIGNNFALGLRSDEKPWLQHPNTIIHAQRLSGTAITDMWCRRVPLLNETALRVLDHDDWLWGLDSDNTLALAHYGPERLAEAAFCIAASDALTVSTEPLRERFSIMAPDVPCYVVPNMIRRSVLELPRKQHGSKVRVIWAGSGSHTNSLNIVSGPLHRLLARSRGKVQVWAYGGRPATFPKETRVVGWTNSSDDFLKSLIGDVVVAPLADTVFNSCKSDLRLLVAWSRGLPVVASRVGPYKRLAELHGVAGFFVDTQAEWDDALWTLTRDRALREKMGVAGKAWVTANRILENNLDNWLNVYDDVLKRGPRK